MAPSTAWDSSKVDAVEPRHLGPESRRRPVRWFFEGTETFLIDVCLTNRVLAQL